MRRVTFVVVLAVLLATLLSPVPGHTQTTPDAPVGASVVDFKFGLVPGADPATTAKGYFVYTLKEGDEAAGMVRVKNPGSEPVTVKLAPVDGITAQTGGSAFTAPDTPPTHVGAWVHLKQPSVTVAPGDGALVPFTITLPSGTAPGQYLAGISAYIHATPQVVADIGAKQVGASITLQTRYVIGIEVDVPGDWEPSLQITNAHALEQPSGTRLGIDLRNDGDTLLEPEGTVTLTDATGKTLLLAPIKLGTIVTGTDVTYPVAWPGVPLAGDYGVAVELTYAGGHVARYDGTLSVSANVPAAQGAQGRAQSDTSALAKLPTPMRVIYAIIGLLALIILPAALFVRGARNRW